MPYIIPNATDTTGGNKYTALDQAEPDSIDFEVLGNGLSGVISGGEVTVTASSGTVRIAAATVVINGVAYPVLGSDAFSLGATPTTKRFDVIVARLTGSTVAYTLLEGTSSASNPTFPKSNSTVVSSSSSYYTPSTDTLIAVVYREGASVVSGNIVDKRKMLGTATPYQGSTAPSATQGATGDMYVRTGAVAAGESGVYVKRSNSGEWTQLAPAFSNPGIPIGGILTWIAPTAPDLSVWALCDGSTKSKTGSYAQLYNVLSVGGTITSPYGEAGTSFSLPNLRGMYLVGATQDLSTSGVLNVPVGNASNQVALVANNIPQHTHPIDHGHTGTTGSGGAHSHAVGGEVTDERYDFAVRRHSIGSNDPDAYTAGHYVAPFDKDGSGYASLYQYTTGDNVTDLPGMSTWHTTSTDTAANHTHPISISLTNGLTSGNGGQVTPTAVNIQPRSLQVAYYIRYA